MRLTAEVKKILADCRFEEGKLYLPQQLPRELYLKVDKALKAMGGKWNRKEKAHLFDSDPREKVGAAVETGTLATPQEEGFFETPKELARLMVGKAMRGSTPEPGANLCWLEPSAGHGVILEGIFETIESLLTNEKELGTTHTVVALEMSPDRYGILAKKYGHRRCFMHRMDFLEYKPDMRFDKIVMNPPFARQQDIDHVKHALELLAPGGTLVSVMAAGVKFRENKKTDEFVAGLSDVDHDFEDLPGETFKESGTGVSTVLLTVRE